MLPDPKRVSRVLDEIERGLTPTRPEFLKWICDKLSALPTQTATGMNAALWTDNVIDVCERYPEDLLQNACLELLRSCTFRPSPAEIVKAIDDRFEERKRMLVRARQLLPEDAPKPGEAFQAEPTEHRLRHLIWRGWEVRTGLRPAGFLAERTWAWAQKAERDLAAIEQRAPADWARIDPAVVRADRTAEPAPKPTASALRTRERLAELAQARRGGVRPSPQPAPKAQAEPHALVVDEGYGDVPEGEDYEQAAA